jgi:hypothetical protein
MYTLFSLPFLLPTFCMLQIMSLPRTSPRSSISAVRDTFASDLE